MSNAIQRSVLVTGASRNIGREIALAFARDGAFVLVHAGKDQTAAQETADLVEQAGGKAAVDIGDLADPETPARLVHRAVDLSGRLDVVVANAAIRPEATFETLPFEEWRRVMALALDSVFLLAQAALPHLRRGTDPSFIAIGGMTGQSGAKGRPHVVAAKAGVSGLVKALAHEVGSDGITVNCVSPGLIHTQRQGPEPAHHAERRNPLQRLGTASEVAAAVHMLAGPEARFITGQTLHVNGGALMP